MMKNKSTLAKLLAEEDVFVVHKQMETAYFDSKKRELGLPIWKDEEMTADIYDLMVCHEIGHARWTPLDMLEAAAVRKIDHSFVNILEDARIEGKVKSKYPGSVGVFNRGYVDLLKKDFFGTVKKNIASFNLIDRINVFFKSGDTTIPFSDEEKVWVNRTASTETPDDVLDLAEELYAWMEENAPEETETADPSIDGMPGMGMPGESDESGESNESGMPGESDESGMPGESDESDESGKFGKFAEYDGKGENDDDTDETESPGGMGGTSAESSVGNDSDSDDRTEINTIEGGKNSTSGGSVPKATTDTASKNGLDALRDKDANDREYANIPKLDTTKFVVNYKKILDVAVKHYNTESADANQGPLYFNKTLEEIETLKKESKKTVAYMVKEFEMKKSADQYARATTAKTGSLDMSALHTYKFNEDLFKKVTTLPGATNHGLVMVVDWSGSMAQNLKGTIAQLFNLIWFCRRAKIPFEVLAFSDRMRHLDEGEKTSFDLDKNLQPFKAGDIKINDFMLLNFFSSNMNIKEENVMMHALWMLASRWGEYRDWSKNGYPYMPPTSLNLGGTPLNDSIIAMMDYVPRFKINTGVQKVHTVFLTDGASNSLDGVMDLNFDSTEGKHTEVVKSFAGNSYVRRRHVDSIITDPITNKKYNLDNNKDITNLLLEMLKNRIDGMNVVGFFLAGSGRAGRVDKNTLAWVLGINSYSDEMKNMLHKINKEKFIAVTGAITGYDEYYILAGGKALTPENETLSDELVGAGKSKLKTAFAKSQKGKITSRILLNRFVKMVA